MVVSDAKRRRNKIDNKRIEDEDDDDDDDDDEEEEEDKKTNQESLSPSSSSEALNAELYHESKSSSSLVPKCDHIWVKTTPGSQINLTSFDPSCYLLYQYKITIQVPVYQTTDIILGTDLTVDSLQYKENRPEYEYDFSKNNVLFLYTSNDMIVFSRHEVSYDFCSKTEDMTFPVDVQSSFKHMRMEGMTESLWECLQQALEVSKRIFQLLVPVQHYLQEETHDPESQVVIKTLTLVMDIHLKTKIAIKMFEDMHFIQNLPIEDQIILFKEIICSSIIDLHTQDRETNTYCRTALGSHLFFQWNLHFFEGMDEYQRGFKNLFDNTLDILRFDPFVITLLIIIFFLRDKPGLTQSQEIHDERVKYFQLLDIYVKAKIKSGQWQGISHQEISSNIYSIIHNLNILNPILTDTQKINPL